ncbi:gamma-glutamyltransferase family protein [Alkalicoccus chagannorensis]|uniref:gamma-glutamyltransferase family protein n=1 Tax=Alkalicoccus chagannorensis TaxID=427072 RepID=UPI0003F9DF03|nr:gamma-glutamyltransferase [Alkalicoccus chagannorensis]
MEERKVQTGRSKKGMVSTASPAATAAGAEMLAAGGNAVDAAVAAAFCLGVSEPQASGIGGQSMGLIHLPDEDRSFALDGSARAPFELSPQKNPDTPMKLGLRAAAVPSTPAALGYLLEQYGSLPLEDILAPSIRACEEGVPVTPLMHRLIHKEVDQLKKDPLASVRFLHKKKALQPGDMLFQPELAETFKRMAEAGWRDFYTGEIAEDIVEDMKKRKGLITDIDLGQIPLPVERDVLESSYRGYDVVTYPPPGAGRVLVQLLKTMEQFDPDELQNDTPTGAVLLALAFRFALNYRQRMPMDPDHFSQSMNQVMIDETYAAETAGRIRDIFNAALEDTFVPPPTAGETTHLSVVDENGMAVGITQSIELVFGSKRMAAERGFFYNNYMSAFEYKDRTHPYYLLPGGRPWSSVAPVMLFKKGRLHYLLGSPGSSRISTTLAQVITRLIDQDESLEEAIAAPRFHSSDSGDLQIEQPRFPREVTDALRLASFQLQKRDAYSFYLGCVQGVEAPGRWFGRFTGAADPRRDGTASGPDELDEGSASE